MNFLLAPRTFDPRHFQKFVPGKKGYSNVDCVAVSSLRYVIRLKLIFVQKKFFWPIKKSMLQTFFLSKNGIKILISSRDISVLNFKQIWTYNWLFA